jgi:hypothetical protein
MGYSYIHKNKAQKNPAFAGLGSEAHHYNKDEVDCWGNDDGCYVRVVLEKLFHLISPKERSVARPLGLLA